jgi:sec-independent protein translocase protein TatC
MITTSAHLTELRQRLIVSFAAIFIFGALSYIFAEQIARYFMTPLFHASPSHIKLVYTNLTEAFITYLKLSLILGVICSIPVLLYELWMFAAPGLHANEKKIVLTLVFWATLLFAAGAGFAFFIVMPRALHFFLGFANPQLTPLPKLSGYLTFVARTSLAFGLAFEIPFLMVAGVKIGWIKRNYFATRRKYFYPAILVLSFLLAAGDIMAATLLCLPLFALYESGILIIRLFSGKAKAADRDARPGAPDEDD